MEQSLENMELNRFQFLAGENDALRDSEPLFRDKPGYAILLLSWGQRPPRQLPSHSQRAQFSRGQLR